jgi:hypothetical protein
VASYRWIEQSVRRAPAVQRAPRVWVVASGLACVALCGIGARALFEARPWLTLTVTRDARLWYPDGPVELPASEPRCELAEERVPFAGATIQVFRPQHCPFRASQHRLLVGGDSHGWGYSAMLRLNAERSGREVRLLVRGGCPLFNMMATRDALSAECRAFRAKQLQSWSQDARAGDILFLPSLRLERFGDQWGQIARRPEAELARARQAAIAEAIRELRPLADAGLRIVFEAPKPIFRAPPFRCSDWFNRHNPVCVGGTTIARAELERMRQPVVQALEQVAHALPGAVVWDPFPVLCPGATCSAFQDGRPLFFDGDHLSGLGNVRLLNDFSRFLDGL